MSAADVVLVSLEAVFFLCLSWRDKTRKTNVLFYRLGKNLEKPQGGGNRAPHPRTSEG